MGTKKSFNLPGIYGFLLYFEGRESSQPRVISNHPQNKMTNTKCPCLSYWIRIHLNITAYFTSKFDTLKNYNDYNEVC